MQPFTVSIQDVEKFPSGEKFFARFSARIECGDMRYVIGGIKAMHGNKEPGTFVAFLPTYKDLSGSWHDCFRLADDSDNRAIKKGILEEFKSYLSKTGGPPSPRIPPSAEWSPKKPLDTGRVDW